MTCQSQWIKSSLRGGGVVINGPASCSSPSPRTKRKWCVGPVMQMRSAWQIRGRGFQRPLKWRARALPVASRRPAARPPARHSGGAARAFDSILSIDQWNTKLRRVCRSDCDIHSSRFSETFQRCIERRVWMATRRIIAYEWSRIVHLMLRR